MNPFFHSAIRLLARFRLPRLDGRQKFAGLEQNVEILRDRWGVPHIFAENRHDLFFAQGYVHAQDRFWQMEFNRRLVSGRLAEILGARALPLDRWFRILTMRRVGEYEEKQLGDEYRSLLQAYAEGVNACISSTRLPIEFTLLNYRPEPWAAADSVSWIKMMAWTLSVNWEVELLRANLIAVLGPETAAELEVPNLPRWPYVIPPDTDYSSLDMSLLRKMDQQIRPFSGSSPYQGLGSNNWVVGSELSATGKPLLANDMHLEMTSPAIWYENHLSCPDFMVTGVTFPGMPGIVSGHNGKVAWGFTNGFPDVQDLYIEHLRRETDGSVFVEHNGGWENARIIKESIRVKGAKNDELEILITRHGPIINELAPNWFKEGGLALQWTALEPDQLIRSVFDFTHAQNCKDIQHALRNWSTPPQNIVYADIHGEIGYLLAGKIPVRRKGNGRVPVPGWVDDYDWTGYLPFELLPHLQNPERGFIVSANNRVVDAKYPVQLELEPVTGDRAQRIVEMLVDPAWRDENLKIGVDQIVKMQADQVSASARAFCRILSTLHIHSSAHHQETLVQAALKLLQSWDGRLSADSPAALIYQVFTRQLARLVLFDRLDPSSDGKRSQSDFDRLKKGDTQENSSLTDFFMGKGPTPVLADTSLFGERWLPWLLNEIQNSASTWFDLGHGESRDDCIQMALESTVAQLSAEFGSDISNWDWGKKHQLTFNHNLGSIPLLGSVFNIGPFSIGGDHTTVWASGASYHDLNSSHIIGPPYRMIIDLGDLKNSIAVLVPGQSGNPASDHYSDQVEDWFHSRYHPMLIDRSEIEKRSKHRLVLYPEKK